MRSIFSNRPRLVSAFAIGVLAIVDIGCQKPVDLVAVQKFAQTTADASNGFASIAADFSGTCLRQRDASLLLPKNILSRDLAFVQIRQDAQFVPASSQSDAPTPSPSPSPSPSPLAGYTEDEFRCENSHDISVEWAYHNKVLLDYVHALGAIAAVDALPSFAPDPLASALVGFEGITKKQADGASKLSSTFAQTIIQGEQRNIIARMLSEVDEPLNAEVMLLEKIDFAYGLMLHNEFGNLQGNYTNLIRQEEADMVNATPQERDLLENQILQQRGTEKGALEQLNTRNAASIAYAGVLSKILDTHHQLFKMSKQHAAMDDYISIFNKSIVPLYQEVEALKKAVK